MKPNGIKYEFTATPWISGWLFISMPEEMASEIRGQLKWQEEGWGRMKARAKIGSSEWETAIWFDTKHKTYILPLKAEVRKREKIEVGKAVKATVWV